MLDTPVLLLIFNRPDTTRRVFEAIRQARPKRLFVAADGPRPARPDDAEKCRLAREVVAGVDWDCDVRTLFRTENLGCGRAVSGAITWFFEQVEEGIILEDDIVPNRSFFYFCSALLKHYRFHDRIMHIGGSSLQFSRPPDDASYYFSAYPMIWGWATWRRAWKKYDFNMESLDGFWAGERAGNYVGTKAEEQFWSRTFSAISRGETNTWDGQWVFSVWNQGGLAIAPHTNLVSNVGFGADATHGSPLHEPYARIKTREISQLVHPRAVAINRKADRSTYRNFLNAPPSFANQCRNLAYRFIPVALYERAKKIKNQLVRLAAASGASR